MSSLEIRCSTVASVPLAVVARQVTRDALGAAIRDGCGRAFAFARDHGLKPGRNVAVYRDGSIQLESGVELQGAFEGQDGVVRSATPAGLAVSATFIGPYERLDAAHRAIHEWCRANGYRPSGPSWEVYGHWQPEWNSDPSQVRTDVFYLVEGGTSGDADTPRPGVTS